MNRVSRLFHEKRDLLSLVETEISANANDIPIESIGTNENTETLSQKKRKRRKQQSMNFLLGKMGLKIDVKPHSKPILTSVFGSFWSHIHSDTHKPKRPHLWPNLGHFHYEPLPQTDMSFLSKKDPWWRKQKETQNSDTPTKSSRIVTWLQNLAKVITNYSDQIMAEPEPEDIRDCEWISGFGIDHYLTNALRMRKRYEERLKEVADAAEFGKTEEVPEEISTKKSSGMSIFGYKPKNDFFSGANTTLPFQMILKSADVSESPFVFQETEDIIFDGVEWKKRVIQEVSSDSEEMESSDSWEDISEDELENLECTDSINDTSLES